MDEFEMLATKLDKLAIDPRARMGYDMFAGGLVWSDEFPEWEVAVRDDGVPTVPGQFHFRALLNHRNSLIRGKIQGAVSETLGNGSAAVSELARLFCQP